MLLFHFCFVLNSCHNTNHFMYFLILYLNVQDLNYDWTMRIPCVCVSLCVCKCVRRLCKGARVDERWELGAKRAEKKNYATITRSTYCTILIAIDLAFLHINRSGPLFCNTIILFVAHIQLSFSYMNLFLLFVTTHFLRPMSSASSSITLAILHNYTLCSKRFLLGFQPHHLILSLFACSLIFCFVLFCFVIIIIIILSIN